MSAPELIASPGLPRDAAGPVFAEPWEATAFALAVALYARGAFTWPEWAQALSETLAEQPDDGSGYYARWLETLERLVTQRGLAEAPDLADLKSAWAEAYLHTPHGQPVELKAGLPRPGPPR